MCQNFLAFNSLDVPREELEPNLVHFTFSLSLTWGQRADVDNVFGFLLVHLARFVQRRSGESHQACDV